MGERERSIWPDAEAVRFGNFFFQADVTHIVMLHAAGMKAGFLVNGRECFQPWTFEHLPAPSALLRSSTEEER